MSTPPERPSPRRSTVVFLGVSLVVAVVVVALSLGSIGSVSNRGGAAPTTPASITDSTQATPTDVPSTSGTSSGSPTPTAPPTQSSIPAVVAAVESARRGAPIPAHLIPPLGDIRYDQYPPIPNCWGMRNEPGHLAKCSLFTSGSRGTIVLIGDSHGRSWLTPLSWMARRNGWTVVPLWHPGCWPAAYFANGECETFARWAGKQVRVLRPDVVLVAGNFPYGNSRSIPKTTDGVAGLFSTIRPFARHVILIGDPPSLRFDPTACLSAPHSTLRTCTATLLPAQVAAYEAAGAAAMRAGGGFIDTAGWFCFDKECPAVVGRTVTHRVKDHITHSYGATLVELFRSAFRRTLSE